MFLSGVLVSAKKGFTKQPRARNFEYSLILISLKKMFSIKPEIYIFP